jgi:prepilin-type processing-associated H-X9-DG protein
VQPPDYVSKYVADLQTPPPLKIIKVQLPGSSIMMGDRWTNVNSVNSGVGIDPACSADYHLNGSNYALADGHVEQILLVKTLADSNYLWRFSKE